MRIWTAGILFLTLVGPVFANCVTVNGTKEGTEECDGVDFGPPGSNPTCGTMGFAGGDMRCTPECRLDVSECGRYNCAAPGISQACVFVRGELNAHNCAPDFDPICGPPPPGPCGVNNLCGEITAAGDPSIKLSDILIELRDEQGRYLRSAYTGTDGRYTFTGIGPKYYVMPVAGRTQVAFPNQRGPLGTNGDEANFEMRGIPARVEVRGTPLSLALFTQVPPLDPVPPVTGLRITTAVGERGTVDVDLHAQDYYLTCWNLLTCTGGMVYRKSASIPITGLRPQQAPLTLSCPMTACP